MTASPWDSALLKPLVSDEETASLFSDQAAVRAMLDFEVALAVVQERMGLIPRGAAQRIHAAAGRLKPQWEKLGTGTAKAGHPVSALVGHLRSLSGSAADHVHRGATAQDVIDTALVLRLSQALDLLDARLGRLGRMLRALAERHRHVVMAGRTRTQQAVPSTFGLKVAGWLLPVARHRERLDQLRPRSLAVQLGGAAGTLGSLGSRGVAVMDALARELGLSAPPAPWHSQRDGMAEVAGWLALVSGSLAKMGQDMCLLAQSEVAEASDGSAGGSSAMPHKANPVRSEILVALGRANAAHLASMHQAMTHEHERSGAAWTLEWLTLPQMAVATGASLRLGLEVAGALEPHPTQMLGNLRDSGERVLAEAAAVLLAERLGTAEAQRLVAAASRKSIESGRRLTDILAERTEGRPDWTRLRDPAHWLGSASELIDRAIQAGGGQVPERSRRPGRAGDCPPP